MRAWVVQSLDQHVLFLEVGTDVLLDTNSLQGVIKHIVHDELLLAVGLQVVFDEDHGTAMGNTNKLVL